MATVNEPFIRLDANVASPDGIIAPGQSATWRVANGGLFYDAGAFKLTPTGQGTADMPLKKGQNVIDVTVRDEFGAVRTQQFIRNVNEFRYDFAEGALDATFESAVTASHPGDPSGTSPANVRLDFLRDGNSERSSFAFDLLPNRTDSLLVGGGDEFGTFGSVVHSLSAFPLILERTTYGNRATDATGPVAPATRWLFSEGAQGFFDTFISLTNDNDAPVDATVAFLLDDGTTVKRVVSMPAHQRTTFHAADVPQLDNRAFGIEIIAPLPIVAERTMYFPRTGPQAFEGSHSSAGVNEPRQTWHMAEGATGPFFDTYFLLVNPSTTLGSFVSLTYLLPNGGGEIRQTVILSPRARRSINVETVDPRLANTTFSTLITASVPIVAERSMFWPGNNPQGWLEAHNNVGVADPALRWGLTNVIDIPRFNMANFVHLMNPNPRPADIEVRFLVDPRVAERQGVPLVVTRTYSIPARNRLTIRPFVDPQLADCSGIDIRVLNFQPIVVEKSQYWDPNGGDWTLGTNVTGTRLPPP